MEQNRQVISGSSAPREDPAQLLNALQNSISQATLVGSELLDGYAQLQHRRVARMADLASVLSKDLGESDPTVITLQSKMKVMSELKAQFDNQTARLKAWPKPGPTEWAVLGTVLDSQGKPAAGLTVRIQNSDRKYADLFGETTANEHGDFSVLYHERDFKATGETPPDFYVLVIDAEGNELYSSPDNVHYQGGRSDYFAIHLAAKKSPIRRKKA
jgi:hypothetical protein